MTVNIMCVIGAGTMGTGIAQIAAQAGIRVYLLDTSEEAISCSQERLDGSLRTGIEREKISPEEADDIRRLITWETSYEPLAEADWVIEAVFEDLEVKKEVLERVAALVGECVPVATNTSSLLIRDLGAFFGRPQYFLGMHFSNPPPAMKLVEVIPGDRTLPAVTEAAVALCERMGKVPAISRDIPGFVLNRLFGALVAAAVEIWAGGAEPEAIDSSIELGLGHRMGPLRTADLVGLDVMLALLRSLHAQTGHARFEVPNEFVELVESGKLGRKSGEGFYQYLK
ncbi:MAG: 3-hydroxyacyl-CoA dehydrogenase family protein [Armatimonadetes bacterium]|nr:3-hydroxyacyl-CoA dehydrogenase family protein [Armatimonadota bacterium]